MITPESIDITKLSSLSLADKRYLPTFAACYLVLEEGRVIYVGQSGNLRSRWRNYHPKLKPLRNRGTEIKIAWLECSDPNLLSDIENALIAYFQPEMNGKKVLGEREFIQVPINPEDKADFDAWCEANSTTMTEVVRRAIAPYIVKGGELAQQCVS